MGTRAEVEGEKTLVICILSTRPRYKLLFESK